MRIDLEKIATERRSKMENISKPSFTRLEESIVRQIRIHFEELKLTKEKRRKTDLILAIARLINQDRLQNKLSSPENSQAIEGRRQVRKTLIDIGFNLEEIPEILRSA